MPRDLALTEAVPIPDTFATGVSYDFHAEYVRIIYWAEHPAMFGGTGLQPTERVVVAKMVMPRADFERAGLQLDRLRAKERAKEIRVS